MVVKHVGPRVGHALLLGGTAFLFLATSAAAQNAPVFQLGELVVTARRPVSELGGTVRVIDAKEIQATGARTLDEALALLPGLNIRTGGAGVPRVDMRGLRSRHVILLLNGVPLNSTYDGQFDPSFIPVDNIAKIKVVTGTASVLYGQGGLAGVIDIVTKQGMPGLRGQVSGELRQTDGRLVRGVVSGGIGNVDVLVTGSASSAAGYPSVTGSPTLGATTPGERLNSDHARVNVFGLASAAPAAGVHLGLSMGHSDGSYGIPPGLISGSDPFVNRTTYDRVTDRRGDFTQLAGSYDVSGAVQVRSWAYLNALNENEARYDDSTYSSMSDPTVKGTHTQASRTSLRGAETQLSVEGRWGRATLALSGERDGWRTNLDIRDVSLGGTPRTWGVRDYTDDRSLGIYGTALEYQVRPVDRLGFVAGYMYDWLSRDSVGTTGAGGTMAAAYYDVVPGMRVRASAAHKFRFPTISQLYDENGGNPNLRTELANVYELGVSHTLPAGSRVGLTLYRMDVRDYIERPAQGEPFANFDVYRMRGIELTAETHPLERLSLRGGYSFLDARDYSPGATRQQLQYRPRHRIAAEGEYRFAFGTRLAASYLRVGDQFYYSRQAPVEKAKLPAFTIVNAHVSQTVLAGRARLYVGADNLLDVAYEDQYGSPQATRVMYGGVSVRW
jgi:vitamin B12 transporter